MSQLRVLIVGASIAGPTAAYWFAKAGASVTVIERFPKLRTNGQNIDIRTAGVTVMRKMTGMEAAVRAKVLEMDGLSWVRDDGRPYGLLKATGNPDQQSLVSEFEIFRGELARILFDMTKDNVKYVFGEQVASIQQDGKADGPVTVEFANGLSSQEYDLVVACDGAMSRTRAIGLGCGLRDYVKPTGRWAAFFSVEQDLLKGSKVGQAVSAVGGRFAALKTVPSGGTQVTLMNNPPQIDDAAALQFREAAKQGDDALKRFMAKHYEGVGWKIPEAIRGMMDTKDFYANEIVQVKTPSLYAGRFVLVGDAGYAAGPTGGGTTLCLAGAYLLAGEISKYKGDLTAGLRGYEQQMRPLIDEMQKIPPFVSTIMAPQTAWGIWLRNNIFALVCWTGIVNFVQRYLASAFASAEEYPLPDYEWEN